MKQRKLTLIRVCILLVSLGLSVSAGRTIVDLWRRRDILRVREAQLAALVKQNEDLTRKLSDVQSNAYVERVARDKLGFVKEGESIVIIPEATSGGSAADRRDANAPNWKKWWSLFF